MTLPEPASGSHILKCRSLDSLRLARDDRTPSRIPASPASPRMTALPRLQSLLFGVTFTDPATFALAVGTLVVVAALAGYLPAREAALVNPAETLRAE